MQMPTINELMKKVGIESHSVRYRDSRAVLKALERPVYAYGFGYGGFVAIYPLYNGAPRAVGYALKHLHTSYPDGGFYNIKFDKALDIIKKNAYFVERSIDESNLNAGLSKKGYMKDFVGYIIAKTQSACWTERLNVYKLRNGNYRFYESYQDNDEGYRTDFSMFMKMVNAYQTGKKKNYDNQYERVVSKKITIPEDIIKDIEMKNLAEMV